MSRRPPLIVGLVIVTLVVLLVGVFELGGSLFGPPGQVVQSVFTSGYLTPHDRVVARGLYLPGGPAKIGYSLDVRFESVRFESSDTTQRLSCAIKSVRRAT